MQRAFPLILNRRADAALHHDNQLRFSVTGFKESFKGSITLKQFREILNIAD
jgi:hypothetical protein